MMRGWIQGYNARAAVNEHQLFLAADAMVGSPDFGRLEPMLNAIRSELTQAGIEGQPVVAVADAGYRHQKQRDADGATVMITPMAAGAKDRNGLLGRRALCVHACGDQL